MRAHGPFTPLEEFRECVLELARGRRERASADGATEPLERYLPRHLADLHLARACARHPRDDRAWLRMLELHSRPLLESAARFDAGEAEVNELFADLWFVRPGGGNLLASYAGLAPLGAWLQLVLRRRLARRGERERTWRALPDDDPAPGSSPHELVAREELLAALDDSLRRSLAALGARDRDFMEARLFRREEGVSIARRHGVSPSYVSRRSREVLELLRRRLLPLLDRFGFDVEALG